MTVLCISILPPGGDGADANANGKTARKESNMIRNERNYQPINYWLTAFTARTLTKNFCSFLFRFYTGNVRFHLLQFNLSLRLTFCNSFIYADWFSSLWMQSMKIILPKISDINYFCCCWSRLCCIFLFCFSGELFNLGATTCSIVSLWHISWCNDMLMHASDDFGKHSSTINFCFPIKAATEYFFYTPIRRIWFI